MVFWSKSEAASGQLVLLVGCPSVLRVEARGLGLERLGVLLHHVFRGIVLRLVLVTVELGHVVADAGGGSAALEPELHAAGGVGPDGIHATELVGATAESAVDAGRQVHAQLIGSVT